MAKSGIVASEAIKLSALVDYQEGAIVSRQILKTDAGNVTMFAFDSGEQLSEHTSPSDALVQVVDGQAEIRIAGELWCWARETSSYCRPMCRTRFWPVIVSR